jgi:DNA replication and repair protein RecF
VPSVLFEPDDMRLLTGSPEIRRDFFDAILTETNPGFGLYKNQYKRTLAQRNNLLKNPEKIKNQIFAWNVRMGELAGKIVELRLGLLKEINKNISLIYSQIADAKTKVNINYETQLDVKIYESSMVQALEKSIETDILRGYTYFGPHREDYSLHINNNKAGAVASRGETRTLVLSLKLLEINILEEKRNQKPLVLLDDVFSELDGTRRKALTNYLNQYQVLITTTDADVIQKNFAQSTNLISLG